MNYLIIPAYQPDLNLVKLVRLVHAKSDLHIIVVDDGSDADKKVIFDKLEGLATVLSHEHNQGKGQALKTAYAYILERGTYGSIVTADADGQHKIWDIFRVVNQSQEHPGTLILGARAFSGKVPLRSAFGNKLTRFLFKQQTGVAVSDTQTGLRAFTTNLLPFMLEVDGQRYEYEMNVLLAASKSFPIVEVPIETVYINDNEGSHFRPIRDGLMIYKDMFKFALSSLSSFIVDYLVYAFFLFVMMAVPISLRILLANGIARVTSSIFNYSTNKHLVFKNKDSVAKTGSGYFGLALGLFILDTLLIRLFYTAFGNKLTRFLFKQQTGVAVSDTQTGLRAFTTNLLPFMLEVDGQRYEYEMNVLLAASKSFPIVEVPIETVYINDNEGSHFRPIRDGLMIYKDMFKFALSSLSSFIVDYLVYAFFLFVMMAVPISLRILLANGIARVTSSIFNYSTNKHLVFKNKDSVAKTGSGYFGLALGLFILDTLLIRLFYTAFGLNLLISKIVVGFLLFLVSWVIQKKVIFKERTAPHHEIL